MIITHFFKPLGSLTDDELMLGKMPEPDLFNLFEELVEEAAEDNYIYIYMDDLSILCKC